MNRKEDITNGALWALKEDASTSELWALIEANALLAQKHVKWDLYLLRIKAVVQKIEERMERFKRQRRCEQLVQGTTVPWRGYRQGGKAVLPEPKVSLPAYFNGYG